jgi:hypothetical protein
MRNPDWTFEETVLALDLYKRVQPNLPDEFHPDVKALSATLIALAASRGVAGTSSFRNPTGVAMKLGNLSRLDPKRRGQGLSHGSKTEDEVWRKFGDDPAALRMAAEQIRLSAAQLPSREPREDGEPSTVRIWITGMWGFTPEVHGYVGFTNEGPRRKYLESHSPGDLMLVIGQNGETADPRDVGRLLGLVELTPTPVDETQCMTSEAYVAKKAQFGADRWRHALPVEKAWKLTREVKARDILPVTCHQRNARAIGSSCMLLTDTEVEAILRLPSVPVPVWGRPEWNSYCERAEKEVTVDTNLKRGPKPFHGDIAHSRLDGENFLYVMRLTGPVEALYGRKLSPGSAVIKFGMSNDVTRRASEMNCGFPPDCSLQWKPILKQRFACADDAFEAETALLQLLRSRGYATGGEFALVPEREIASIVASVCRKSAFVIAA